MMNYIRKSLNGKLVLSFLIVSLVPIAAVGYLSFYSARATLEKSVLSDLSTAVTSGKNTLSIYLDEAVDLLRVLSVTEVVMKGAEELTPVAPGEEDSSAGSSPENSGGTADDSGEAAVRESLHTFFRRYLEIHREEEGFKDVLIINPQGDVVFSQKGLSDAGTNLDVGPLQDSGLARTWRKVAESGQPYIADFSMYKPVGEPAMFFGVPITSVEGQLLGILCMRLGPERINEIMKGIAQIGETGDAYLVGNDSTLRSVSRTMGGGILKTKVELESNAQTLAETGHGTGASRSLDSDGVSVLNAWSRIGLHESEVLGAKEWDWAIIVRIDSSEAFQPIYSLGYTIILIGLAVALAVVGAAFFLSRSISRPVSDLASRADRIAAGNLTVDVNIGSRTDEIGSLTHSFVRMVEALRRQATEILEGVNVLNSAATEISATVTQVVANTSETSTAVAETTATAEQVRQAATLTNQKAKNLSEAAQRAAQVSVDGRRATEDTTNGMNLIKQQMESVGNTVVRLSEQSRAIEDIIMTVQDLADQSNLLAVNASIEAARAGDQGKGFAVVAHEIKNLADQSKEATDQVRGILDDTRKWVSAVVMATEQGTKAVEAGAKQSSIAGEAIEALASGVMESSQAASTIETTSQQQTTGVEQVALAMGNIQQAVQHNLSGMNQLRESAERLEELGKSLKQTVQKYQV